jgi:phenylalanyl-tRNA synthetase beta chain
MNISYNWLREFVEVSLAPRELAARLTMVGLAVDAVYEAAGDFVLEFDLTSNRPDCLSHLGIAREAAALEGKTLHLPRVEAARVEGRTSEFASVRIEDEDLCPRYAARVVRGVKIGPSPAWLAGRLQAIGQRPINNVADITNFVLHELGQPLHAFDLSTLKGSGIVVRRARAGERLRTLDAVDRELDAEMLVIADAERAVALAGVMGGEETEIKDSTTDVLIESAYFQPESVRRTSKQLGLHTEASYRFERGTDYEGVRLAQDRSVALICELAGGTAAEDAIDVYPRPVKRPAVSLRPRRVGKLTGLVVPAEESAFILGSIGFERLGARAERDAEAADALESSLNGAGQSNPAPRDSAMTFGVPSWRGDVSIEEDLVEEVARHFGYDKITDELPASGIAGEYRPGEMRRREAKRALVGLGFDEAISFSFIDASNEGLFEVIPALRETAGQSGDDGAVRLTNPIIEGAGLMRPTLLAGLLAAVRHNLNHGTRNVRLFESGRVFAAAAEGERPVEREALALILTGAALEEGRAGAARELDFHDLKGALEAALGAAGIAGLAFEPASVRHLREGQAARVLLRGVEVGTLGRLSEGLAAAHKFRQPAYVAEVDFGVLLETEEQPVRYRQLPRYPSVVRDVSLLVGRRVTFDEARRAVHTLGLEHLRGLSLVDVYEGANLPEGQRSITLRAEYRSDERTLRDEEADEAHARVVAALETSFGAKLRG